MMESSLEIRIPLVACALRKVLLNQLVFRYLLVRPEGQKKETCTVNILCGHGRGRSLELLYLLAQVAVGSGLEENSCAIEQYSGFRAEAALKNIVIGWTNPDDDRTAWLDPKPFVGVLVIRKGMNFWLTPNSNCLMLYHGIIVGRIMEAINRESTGPFHDSLRDSLLSTLEKRYGAFVAHSRNGQATRMSF